MDDILIMGGSTFVSSSLAKYLIGKGHIVDILTRGFKEIKYEGYRNHIVCDRKNKDELEKSLENKSYKFIFDISAYTEEDVKILIECVNINMLNKYIFCSSGAVYKESIDIINEDYDKTENIHWGKYGVDKKEAEDYIINSDINYAIFRPSYIYGEENNLYRESYFFDRIKENKVIPVPFGNNTTTQFIYIDDMLKVFESAIYSLKNKGIYNVTNPEIVSWEQLINTCSSVAGNDAVIKNILSEAHEVRSYFPFRDVTYMLSIETLINDGLYVPKISLVEGLEKSYKWYLENNIRLSDKRMNKVEELSMELGINKKYVLDTAKELLEFNSPSGFCFDIMKIIEKKSVEFGYNFETTNKGCGIITIPGDKNEKVIGLSAHVDTLGAMVRSITSTGTLKFELIGGPIVPTLDGEYCTIRTREGKLYSGTFLSTSPAAHVFEDSSTKKRDTKNMEVRIDEVVSSKDDVKKLGICAGDFIFIDPKTTITESGFIKSRFIDDKASVAALMGLLELMSKEKVTPLYTTKIFISTYEEVGHGSAYIPSDITEMIAVDMGCIGDDLSCTEYEVSICAKDSSGPYDYNMTTALVNLAKENDIDFAVDIYPMYGSDVSSALRAGNNIRGALIGPGVHASHGMERTHYKGLENTIKLLYLYLTK